MMMMDQKKEELTQRFKQKKKKELVGNTAINMKVNRVDNS